MVFFELLRRSSFGLHFRSIKENAHLRFSTGFVKGNGIQNVVSVCLQRPRAPERVVPGSSNKCVESIRALAGHLEALVRIQDIYGWTVPEMRWEGAER